MRYFGYLLLILAAALAVRIGALAAGYWSLAVLTYPMFALPIGAGLILAIVGVAIIERAAGDAQWEAAQRAARAEREARLHWTRRGAPDPSWSAKRGL